MSQQKTFADKSKDVLLSKFDRQIHPVEVASRRNMSLRTFKRWFAEEKITFRQISNNLRKELALSVIDSQHSKKPMLPNY